MKIRSRRKGREKSSSRLDLKASLSSLAFGAGVLVKADMIREIDILELLLGICKNENMDPEIVMHSLALGQTATEMIFSVLKKHNSGKENV